MTKLSDAGNNAGDNATKPVVFATNELEIIAAPGNPKGVTGVFDCANPDVIVNSSQGQKILAKYGFDSS